jgi:hypothetical protein
VTDDTLTVRCACGWEQSGAEVVVVPATIEHGRRLHNMEATSEQVLAMAVRPGTGAGDTASTSAATTSAGEALSRGGRGRTRPGPS